MLQQEDGSWIDAGTLHKELKVGKDFTTWIKGRISKYEFVENEDYKLDSPELGSKNLMVVIENQEKNFFEWVDNQQMQV